MEQYMENKSKRPGVMLYFADIKPALNRMNDEQCGRLLRAIISYAEDGEKPELDGIEALVFDLMVPKIDRDDERYEESREQRQYAVYVRKKKKYGETFLPFPEWKLLRLSSKNNEPISPDNEPMLSDNERYPSTTASTSPTASASTFTGASGAALSLGKGIAGGFRGEEGKNQELDKRRAYFCEKLGAYDRKT